LDSIEFWLFSRIGKSTLSEQRFHHIRDVRKNVMAALKVILIEKFCESFQQWQHCLANCVSVKGDCSEGYFDRGVL
jgi:hypothetical protein